MKEKLLAIFILLFSLVGISQPTTGTIKIRKTNPQIIGKTLSLFDLRTQECGTIFFESETDCSVIFNYEKEELRNLKVFLNSENTSKIIECEYTLISDTSFILTSEDYSDTCFYRFINTNNNIVRFNNTPQGVFDNNGSYAFFYGFDSIIYSQSFLRSRKDFLFTDSLLLLDSIYKDITNEEERKLKNEELKQKIKEYRSGISYKYFVGKYSLNGRQINLINRDDGIFGHLFLQEQGDFFSLFTHSTFDGSFPLVSHYTHKVYGKIQLNYDSAFIQYKEFNPQKNSVNNIQFGDFKDGFLTVYPIASNIYLYKGRDTLWITNSVFLEMVKFKNRMGGLYSTHYQSLNGNKIKKSPVFFSANKAYSTSDNSFKDTLEIWNYMLTNEVLFLYNETDTLVDEMKNGFESFRFTYKNSQPFVFGAYYCNNRSEKTHEFILLFENNKGVKLTCSENEYKHARSSIEHGSIIEKEGIKYEYFRYSASDEYVWAEYENGNYIEYNFFNFNKAISTQKGRKKKSFYLVN